MACCKILLGRAIIYPEEYFISSKGAILINSRFALLKANSNLKAFRDEWTVKILSKYILIN